VSGRRYIVSRNHAESVKAAADRTSIFAALERQLAKGDKALLANTSRMQVLYLPTKYRSSTAAILVSGPDSWQIGADDHDVNNGGER